MPWQAGHRIKSVRDALTGIRLRKIANGLVEICPNGKIAAAQFFGKQTAEHRRPGIFALHDMVVVPGNQDAAVFACLLLSLIHI